MDDYQRRGGRGGQFGKRLVSSACITNFETFFPRTLPGMDPRNDREFQQSRAYGYVPQGVQDVPQQQSMGNFRGGWGAEGMGGHPMAPPSRYPQQGLGIPSHMQQPLSRVEQPYYPPQQHYAPGEFEGYMGFPKFSSPNFAAPDRPSQPYDLDANYQSNSTYIGGGAQPQHRLGNSVAIPYHTAGLPQAMGAQGRVGMGGGGRSSGGNNATGGSNAQGRAINKMLLDILRDRIIDPQRLHLAIETFVDRMDCVNLATLLFHTGKKRFLLAPVHVKMIADRMNFLREELRAREASNALYGLKCLSSEIPEVRELVYALANKITTSTSDFVAQAVGNALYGMQMMSSEYEEVRFLLLVLSAKVSQCTELLEAQNVGNALYGLRGMNSDYKEVRAVVASLTPKVAKAKEELNGQALGNSLYGLQSMSSKESEVRLLLTVLAGKVSRTWEELKAQEVGNALYGLKRMSSDVPEVRALIAALVPKIASSPDLLDAQAIGNSFYGLQNMKSDNPEILALMGVLAEKVAISNPELDGQAMGNSLYGLQGMSSDYIEVRGAIAALTVKIQASMLEMNAQELGNALYGLQNMTSAQKEVRRLMLALAQKLSVSKHELTSQEIGNALFGLQGMSSEHSETRILLSQLSMKITQSHSVLDPQGVSNSIFGLQRMSSESQEVRALVHALAFKIEHCWKILSAHHVAHACYGLQCLSSEHPEVRYMLKSLVSKVIACREEMSSKQLSVAFFGLQNLNGNHVEVRALATALAEKTTLSTDSWTPQHIALSVFGLQGFSSDVEETTLVLNILCYKASLTSMQDLDPIMLGNWLYGMQRMSSSNAEVTKMLNLLVTPLKVLTTQPERFTPLICANMLFGIQGCSCSLEPVKMILDFVVVVIKASSDILRNHSPRVSKAAELFQEYVALSQSFALVLSVIPDLVVGGEQHVRCVQALSDMDEIIRDLPDFYPPRLLSAAEQNVVRELQDMVRSEALVVKSPSLAFGFEHAVSIDVAASSLQRSTGETKMIIEVFGSSYCYPAKELFYHLKVQFLERTKGVVIKTVPAESFAVYGQHALQKMHPEVHSAVQALVEEFGFFAGITKGLDFAVGGGNNREMGFPASSSNSNPSSRSNSTFYNNNVPGSFESIQQQQQQQSMFTGSEYYDDELRFSNDIDASHKRSTGRGSFSSQYVPPYHRKPLGMLMGWLGEWPFLNSLQQHGMVSQQFLRFASAASSGAAGLTSNVSSIMGPAATVGAGLVTHPDKLRAMQMQGQMQGHPMFERGMVQRDNTATPSVHHELLDRHSHSFKLGLGSSDSTFIQDSRGHAQRNLLGNSNNVNDDQDSVDSTNSAGHTLTSKMFDQHGLLLSNTMSESSSFHNLPGTRGYFNAFAQQTLESASRDTVSGNSNNNNSNIFAARGLQVEIPATGSGGPGSIRRGSGQSSEGSLPLYNQQQQQSSRREPTSAAAVQELLTKSGSASSIDAEEVFEEEDVSGLEPDVQALLRAQNEIKRLEAKVQALKLKKQQKDPQETVSNASGSPRPDDMPAMMGSPSSYHPKAPPGYY